MRADWLVHVGKLATFLLVGKVLRAREKGIGEVVIECCVDWSILHGYCFESAIHDVLPERARNIPHRMSSTSLPASRLRGPKKGWRDVSNNAQRSVKGCSRSTARTRRRVIL